MRPLVLQYIVRVRAASPQAIALAAGLGQLYGRGINGQTGTIRYGDPRGIQTQRSAFKGYVTPPQIFKGYTARRVAGGAIRNAPARLPSANAPSLSTSPLTRAMATVSAQQLANG